MWPKIKASWSRHSAVLHLSIFGQMVFLYSVIVTGLLIVVSIITLTSVHYMLTKSIKTDLKDSATAVTQYLSSYGRVNASLYARGNLRPFINLQIYDSSGKLILDNTPNHQPKRWTDRIIDEAIVTSGARALPDAIKGSDMTEYSYYRSWTGITGRTYYLRFSRIPAKENDFITLLSKQLLASVLLSLILTISSGMFVMRKSLASLHKIIDTVGGIEVNKLGSRIALSDDQNELHDLAVTINEALDRIEYGYKQQQQFISNASHELRTPITVISGYVDLLDRWGKDDPAVLQESLTAIKGETAYMKDLIERLLFFARSNSGTLKEHFQIIHTAPLMAELFSEWTLISHEHHIVEGPADDAVIYADPGSVKQMLRIFLDNAVKYTPAGGTITLSCHSDGQTVRCSVSDTGIGIPQDEIDKVFARFYRVDQSRNKESGGSGLGLSIASAIAKGNNGTIEIESELGKGTTITAVFPIDAESS